MLDIVAGYHRIQFKGKSKIQTQQNDENPHFGPDLGPLPPYSGHHFFPKNLSASVTTYHCQLSSCIISEKN